MKHISFLAILLVTLLATSALANGSDELLGKVVRGLEHQFRANAAPGASIEDLQADFLQQAYLGSLDRVEEGQGRVAVRFDRRGQQLQPRFRWEYQVPSVQQIISDGSTVWVYLPENQQVVESPLPANGSEGVDDPLAFLTGLGQLSKRFTVAWASPALDSEGHYRLLLKPRQPSAIVERLELVIDRAVVNHNASGSKPVYPVRVATVFGPNESRTTITFHNVRLNKGLKDSLFDFKIPEGVEVLRPDQNQFGF
ncbi:hypothetical protein A7E78_10655 [Syntrophotalea acetylenivorans]|uniref:Outer membrane lipoprotein carrier protein LolA n=1 Tax=Syntrophotalea acetylenivorans TaxID=1842532 RepID=A0A1L3GQN1_9BACT|nr:outer membrane lipoprotein carrier protein LolA [Syntrophotalea acetylenivorans]APG28266.1 hypothetical protein A7E78_10655 [Syntrophotalea acetylenivorans]